MVKHYSEVMELQIRHQPAFSTARATLQPNEQMRLESGAMVTMSPDIVVEGKMEGGFLKALKRSALGGESFFQTTATAGPNGGFVDVAMGLPGDSVILQSTAASPWILSQSSWIASSMGLVLDTKWGGMKSLFGGEGAFLVHVSGDGILLAGAYGAIEVVKLAAGEKIVVDSGHMVAVQASVTMSLHKAATGWMNTIKSGEGLVFHFEGPGEVYTQTRNPNWFGRFASAGHSHGTN
jgi:uncharacterized protein (TIGR00266 family)